jgi:hypothetical protein
MSDARLAQRLHASARRRPFEPFEVELPDGERLTIDDPEAVAVRGDVAVYIGPEGSCTLFESDQVRPLARHSPRRPGISRSTLAGLLILHLLGIGGSVIAAAVQIESIVGTGPAFSVLGLIVAECGRRSRLRSMYWIGLSTLALSLFVFALINIAEWSPAEASVPVPVLLLAYESVVIPLGLRTLWRMFVAAPADARLARQFDLKSLLWLFGLLAVALAAGRAASDQGLSGMASTAIGIMTGTIAVLGLMAFRAEQARARDQHMAQPVRQS